MGTSLKVKAVLAEASVASGAPCVMTVQVSNDASETVLVNSRMAVGYADSLSRELFVEMIDVATGVPPKMVEIDYERPFSPTVDFVPLLPGETVSARFDLFDWYAPLSKGRFRIVVHYQADEPLAKAPDGVAKGVYSSDPLELIVY